MTEGVLHAALVVGGRAGNLDRNDHGVPPPELLSWFAPSHLAFTRRQTLWSCDVGLSASRS